MDELSTIFSTAVENLLSYKIQHVKCSLGHIWVYFRLAGYQSRHRFSSQINFS
jgi:hypothetical protein